MTYAYARNVARPWQGGLHCMHNDICICAHASRNQHFLPAFTPNRGNAKVRFCKRSFMSSKSSETSIKIGMVPCQKASVQQSHNPIPTSFVFCGKGKILNKRCRDEVMYDCVTGYCLCLVLMRFGMVPSLHPFLFTCTYI